ncbi:MAG: FIST C-terminal domain-containing protein [Phycisphaerae bacterium]|nr:FIST C-terminal domain-containing protein [Phycisphaerae bacterium]
MKNTITVILILIVIAAAGIWWYQSQAGSNPTVSSDASGVEGKTPASSNSNRHAAVGWSVAEDVRQAVRDAMAMARKDLGNEKAVFAYVAPTVGYQVETVMEELDKLLEPGAKVYGITSGKAVMTQYGYHVGKVGSIAILLVGEKAGIRFGVGSVDGVNPADLEAQGAEAIRQCIADAKLPPKTKPDMVLYCGHSYFSGEMKILDGIAGVVGSDVPVVGGNARDDTLTGQWRQFTRDKIYGKGLVLAALFTDKKIGWAFESGFRLTDTGGKVTKANPEGNLLYEIDGRPALDVYDEWLGGKLIPVLKGKTRAELVKYTALNPLCRVLKGPKGQVGYLVAHPIPTQQNLEDRALPVYSQIVEGSEIALFAGQWQNLLNRAEKVPSIALQRAEQKPEDIAFGVMYFCWGARNTIPESEVPTIPLLVRNQIPGVPFVGVFTGGEQGPLQGIRNVNCNLVVSMVLLEKQAADSRP